MTEADNGGSMEKDSPDAPRERLAELREFLVERIDGSEETRAWDSKLTRFIEAIDALPSEKGTTPVDWKAVAKLDDGTQLPPASTAATPMKHFSEKVRNKKESEYGPFTNADWNAACALERENADLRTAKQMADHERDAMLEKLIALRSAPSATETTEPVALGRMHMGRYICIGIKDLERNQPKWVQDEWKAKSHFLYAAPSLPVEERTIEWLLGAMVDDEGRLILTRDYIVTCLRSRMKGGEHG